MNPGYMSLWIIIVFLILMATGWKPSFAPDMNRRTMTILGIVIAALLPVSLWWSQPSYDVHFELHVSVSLLLFASLLTYKGDEELSYKGYLVLCTIMIAAIWGFIRKMYSLDPVFYWIDPAWDAPLLAGVLCGAFTSQAKHQFGMIVWSAVLGEVLHAALQPNNYTALIGSLSWWDSFWIAFATARMFSLIVKLARISFSKLYGLLWYLRGGRSS